VANPARIYRRLLTLYPARFREEYAAPLERQFTDEYRDAQGAAGRARFWTRLTRDLLVSVPAQVLRECALDLRHSARVYARRPFVTVLAVAALALAIGATTGVFSVVNAVLLRSLPFRAPDELVQVEPSHGMDTTAGFHRWRTSRPYLADAVSYDRAEMNLSRQADSVRVAVTETSWNFFAMFGSQPVIGRAFVAGEDERGRGTVAVISHALWRQAFGADPAALGSTVRLNGQPVLVVGIAAPAFDFPARTAVWTPTTFDYERLPKTRVTYWETVGRLNAGVSRAQANAMFTAEIEREDPGRSGRLGGRRFGLIPLRDQLAGAVRQASFVLMGAVLFVLLIACANVAHLLLTRTSERRTELMVRATLGASRARLVQQLITESIAVSLVAAVAGLVVAHWVSRLATAAQPAVLALQAYTVLDWRVLTFAILVASLTGVVFGVVPATLACRLQPAETLVRAYAGGAGRGAARLRKGLVVAQASLTLVLLAGSIAMGRSFLALLGVDLGFRTDHVITMSVSLAGSRYDTEEGRRAYAEDALRALRAVPGVASAAAVDFLPLTSDMYMGAQFGVESGEKQAVATVVTVTPDYFQTMGTGILYGREFDESDRPTSEPVCIVSEELAKAVGGGATLVGRKVTSDQRDAKGFTIVGVARSMKVRGPATRRVMPQLFLAYAQRARAYLTFAARVSGSASDLLPRGRDAVQAVDRQVPVFGASTLDDCLAENMARPRFYTSVVVFLGVFALLLSIVGVYGVSSYSIAQRTHEIGVRIAVGASARGVRSMLLRQNLVPVAFGALIGVGAAVGTGRFLEHLLADVRWVDAATCAAASLLLALVAFAAVWSATGRVIRANPLDALRAE
jgi:putative ABC transport system permease protein